MNSDGTAKLLREFERVVDAHYFINEQPSGIYRLEFGDIVHSTIVSVVEIP